ncbi:MAG: hypothetical protein ACHQVS_01680 [Candidatus Babeliales bacterium]
MKYQLKSLFISLLLISTIPAQGMSARVKALLPIIGTAAYYGLIAYPFWANAYKKIKVINEKYDKNIDPGQPITGFVQYELGKIGINKPIPVQMEKTRNEGSAETNGRTISLGFSHDGTSKLEKILVEQQRLVKLLDEDPSNESIKDAIKKTEYDLDWYQFLVQHEGTHIKNHDNEKDLIAHVITPFILCGATRGLNSLIFTSPKPTIGTYAGKIALGLTAVFLGKLAIMQYAKHKEYKADDGVQDDPYVLKAGIEHFKQHEKKQAEEFIKKNPGTSYEELQRFPFSVFYSIHHISHPVPLKRAQRLEQRLAGLQAPTVTA